MKNSPVHFKDFSASAPPDLRLVATDMDGTLTRAGGFTTTLLSSLEKLVEADLTTVIVTGRSAGWVQAVAAYLPIAGAIAENGGVWMSQANLHPEWLVDVPEAGRHRDALAGMFSAIQRYFPTLRPSADNPFRLTDWTFDIGDLSLADLQTIADLCEQAGWGFTYSTVQCHIRPATQNKAVGLQAVLRRTFPSIQSHQVVTVGDSPNDADLFNPHYFPFSVGIANVLHYRDRLQHLPTVITASAEVAGFQELTQALLAVRQGD